MKATKPERDVNVPYTSTLAIDPLSEHECFDRLGLTPFGRVALSSGALPVIFPIHFALLGRNPVFRTDPGTKLMAASNGQVLCLEIDEIDPVLHTGWSVLVTGRADVLSDPDDLEAAELAPRCGPGPARGDAYVRIQAALVSGREIRIRPVSCRANVTATVIRARPRRSRGASRGGNLWPLRTGARRGSPMDDEHRG